MAMHKIDFFGGEIALRDEHTIMARLILKKRKKIKSFSMCTKHGLKDLFRRETGFETSGVYSVHSGYNL